MFEEIKDSMESPNREENIEDGIYNLAALDNDENNIQYTNFTADDNLLEPAALQTTDTLIHTLNGIPIPTEEELQHNLTIDVNAQENSVCDKYKKYKMLLEEIPNRSDTSKYNGNEKVKKLINGLREEYAQKTVICFFCGKKKSIDIVFRHARTSKAICRDCARKRAFKRKEELLDYIEEEPNEMFCLMCYRCHKFREMNQFSVKKWKKVNKITYCKFCRNIRYLSAKKW